MVTDTEKVRFIVESYRDADGRKFDQREREQIGEKLEKAAQFVRSMLEADGYELRRDREPHLKMSWVDLRDSRIDVARTLSIDHALRWTPTVRQPEPLFKV